MAPGIPRWVSAAFNSLGEYIGSGRPPMRTHIGSPPSSRRSSPQAVQKLSYGRDPVSIRKSHEAGVKATDEQRNKTILGVKGGRVGKRTQNTTALKARGVGAKDLPTIAEESNDAEVGYASSTEERFARAKAKLTERSPKLRTRFAKRRGGVENNEADSESDTSPSKRGRKRTRSDVDDDDSQTEISRAKRQVTSVGGKASTIGWRNTIYGSPQKRGAEGEKSSSEIEEDETDDEESKLKRLEAMVWADRRKKYGSTQQGANDDGENIIAKTNEVENEIGSPHSKRSKTPVNGQGSSNNDKAPWKDVAKGKKRAIDESDEDGSEDETPRAKRAKASPDEKSSTKVLTPSSKSLGKRKSDQNLVSEAVTKAEADELDAELRIERGRVAIKGDPDFADRTELELDFFNYINGRGLDPLFPAWWKPDFATYPDAMFFPENFEPDPKNSYEKPLIRSLKDNEFLAIRQFQDLINIGTRVQERRERGRPCSQLLQRGYNKYINWMMADADLGKRDLLPVLIVKANKTTESQETFIQRVQRDMGKLAKQHRARYATELARYERSRPSGGVRRPRAPPVIFAIMIYGTSVVVVAQNAADEAAEPLARANFEYGQYGMDIWHGIGVAIVAALIRDHQLSSGGEEDVAAEETEDPDV